jgi:hypothetical protein
MRSPQLRWVKNPAVARARVSGGLFLDGGAGITALGCTHPKVDSGIKPIPVRLLQESSP